MPDLPLSYEQMRSLVLAYLAGVTGGQLNDISLKLPGLAREKGFLPSAQPPGSVGGDFTETLSEKDNSRVLDIVWDLIIEGVLRPGAVDGGSPNLPFFHLTEFGKARVGDGPESPYDPEGYLTNLRDAVPSIDSVIVTYLQEAMHTFRINCLLSSTIALGCASEKAFLLLIEAYGNALTGDAQRRFRQKTQGRFIKMQFDEFTTRFESHLSGHLPDAVKANVDVTLSGIFTLLRNLRNEVGHPTGMSVSREQAYANLVLFPTYLKKVYQLIEWLTQHPLPSQASR